MPACFARETRLFPDFGAMNTSATPAKRPWSIRRLIPVAVIVAGLALFYILGLNRYVGLDVLRAHHAQFEAWTARDPALAAAVYIALYTVAVAFSLPGGALLTVIGGFLFGLYLGTAYTVVGATLGSIAIFLAARGAFREVFAARIGPFVKRMEAGFRKNAFHYLLILRLVPLFPFWLVNLVPAFLGVPLGTYALATLIGIVPGTVVFVSIGHGLGTVLAAGGSPDLSLILKPSVLGPLLGLAALAAVPVIYKKVTARRGKP
jgi:uncharacterized membrane protein YdjX (TVP38/TMEM64 family)